MFMFRTSSFNLVLLATLFCVLEHVASSPNSTSTFEDSAAPAVTTACTGVSPDPPDFLEGEQIGWNAGFYAPGLGACGIVNTDTDFIVAMTHIVFDAYPGYDGVDCNPICNRPIVVTSRIVQGKSVEVTVTDDCVACGNNEIQLSPAAFEQLADESEGLIDVSWSWAN
ncbi:hypothetical protein C8J55DRAFT_248768 [Lentinula edodes]|uniref:RlpA-like protein double-psi beta-barrel domain-containing protein n=1 Tax=Lentinula lateritia TaxID=40482 RepID=A0A9W8ZU67_9AGAR|nr:hypothetical protein C8J55DRAFT_248768 [Lentinula edodes]